MSGATPYQPANGEEGAAFMEKWCEHCACDDFRDGAGKGCPIVGTAMALTLADEGYPKEWIETEAGPSCTAFIRRALNDQGVLDPYQRARIQSVYESLPRDPVTGRPVIA